ncbi:hypothetical protein C2E21_0636 [Chlorella sorokiniana]|uniref:Uncharacterized protein n=1 Tax=Chlorella sorokiniana TaxID=3076 RepID=A0A2P6U4G3_CHLSO|nr:hypothetical protein C2E21_0636 [Chlorella sorokiniana]|eukprot:PRW61202.1 hypothetical protein C2E21_0636 [Chlorella sorokiniana]
MEPAGKKPRVEVEVVDLCYSSEDEGPAAAAPAPAAAAAGPSSAPVGMPALEDSDDEEDGEGSAAAGAAVEDDFVDEYKELQAGLAATPGGRMRADALKGTPEARRAVRRQVAPITRALKTDWRGWEACTANGYADDTNAFPPDPFITVCQDPTVKQEFERLANAR